MTQQTRVLLVSGDSIVETMLTLPVFERLSTGVERPLSWLAHRVARNVWPEDRNVDHFSWDRLRSIEAWSELRKLRRWDADVAWNANQGRISRWLCARVAKLTLQAQEGAASTQDSERA